MALAAQTRQGSRICIFEAKRKPGDIKRVPPRLCSSLPACPCVSPPAGLRERRPVWLRPLLCRQSVAPRAEDVRPQRRGRWRVPPLQSQGRGNRSHLHQTDQYTSVCLFVCLWHTLVSPVTATFKMMMMILLRILMILMIFMMMTNMMLRRMRVSGWWWWWRWGW